MLARRRTRRPGLSAGKFGGQSQLADVIANQEEQVAPPRTIVIGQQSGWAFVDLPELWRYRDMLLFVVWRDIKTRYSQSAIGIGWALVQPVFFMIAFTFVFGRLIGVKSDGSPYAVFSYIALVPWTYFANSLIDATNSLNTNTAMLTKVYFPRVILPLSAVAARAMDFLIAFALVVVLMAWYRVEPTWWVAAAPVLLLILIATSLGLGMWLTALSVQYRDVRYAIAFMTQLLMYGTPVVYPVSMIPERFHLIYAINPMVGVIEGFRAGFLGTGPMPWDMIGIGAATAAFFLLCGSVIFRRTERFFADVA
jgi:lipopolysaccharide transport system permease protein